MSQQVQKSQSHYFYAVAIPDEIKTKLHKMNQKVQESCPFKRWVHNQDLHLTLAFLGAASEEKLAASIRNVKDQLPIPAFTLSIDHLGVFGKIDSPRIFWAGIAEQQELAENRKKVFRACHLAGFELETRAFHPHITLARKWIGEFPFSKERLDELNPFLEHPIRFQVKNIVLYKTNIGKEPKYEAIKIFDLTND
ncbi:RNA 2',3'-cyclic phosphodiesterase [Bacillus sp. B15-48]|uniref:RNA 2',3'-cyclic phosphodiesterase n=1 Tax=Bacillus sp. B15-48 TaxID=1548601 RepID=UPI00193F1B63|nr:RNA 2',3'-cyclic phosphodiesterase [Bacillus sp. B15-48]MBM4762611.1 RNA 2',3'-cyclic phosphodiesterase [Bacillus sp. B15-48]